MNNVQWWDRSPVGTRRAWRKREELRLRLSGQYGPEWWEVAPAFAAVLAMLALPIVVLGWLGTRVGWWAALLAAAAGAYGLRALLRRRRRRELALEGQRREARFGLDQVDAADDRAFRTIVGRLLLRDGWANVRGVLIRPGVVHLVGDGPDGRQIGVAFDRGVERAGKGNGARAVLRPVESGGPARTDGASEPRALFLIVSSGAFARERVVWAARNDVRLVDRTTLERWAAGGHLAVLLGLGLDDVRPDAS
ncbi:hypothetical protein [Streptomyces sp. SS]|uniref:hypothetical protein n=1 Tax=Streptomyces sp. SS TaxID=260742 RepID=UPI0002DABCAC|nr:hypothetical protein [Streptomyces sp. SS]